MLECYINDKQFETQIIMTEIILHNKSATMQVNTIGGYIDSLILKGREVLFPKTSVQVGDDKKLRGGMHVCLPQFGPDSKNHLAQHGFGRTSDWEIRHQNESDIGLKLISTEKGYEHVEWLLDYSLPNENEAIAILTVCNYGESPVRTSPGFHPYFTAAGTQFDFNGAPYDADYISHTEFVSSNQDAHVAFDGLKLDIRTHNLPVYALWSDRNGQYTCAEPTAEGNAFLSPARGGQFVSGHSKKRYAMKIRLMA